MGQEVECRAWCGGKTGIGKAYLETTSILFRGDFRLQIPFPEISTVEAKGGQLHVVWRDGEATFELGQSAEKWMRKIRNPKGRLDKLGVKERMRVAVAGALDADFLDELASRTADISHGPAKKDADIVFFAVSKKEDLSGLARWKESLKPAGAIWIVYPKGRQDIRESDVRAAGLAAGLVDTKVAAFSPTHSSLKWVIPVSLRKS